MLVSELRKGANGSRIILALDGLLRDEMEQIASETHKYVAGGKIGDAVDRYGAGALDGCGFAIRFIDVKLCDIKKTVENRIRAIGETSNVSIVTVHIADDMDDETLRAAAAVGKKFNIAIVGVTLLTSVTPERSREIYSMEPEAVVLRRTIRARDAGLHGIVCSSNETRAVREVFSEALIINPGIRLEGSQHHDQARVGTPEQAIHDGADLLAVDRDILSEKTPAARIQKLLRYNIAVNDALAFA